MALGAIHRANTIKQLQLDLFHSNVSDKAVPPAYLYSMASRYFHLHLEQLRPSIWFIQIILLICIYTFYGPIGSSQWQLAGLAMRTAIEIGLHYAPRDGQAVDRDMAERSRVFWTAYSIEISLAYNLGRPPSIGEEHITARLPVVNSRDLSFGLHHIKHRRIQSRIVSQVYNARSRDREVSLQERQGFIASLQAELDDPEDEQRALSWMLVQGVLFAGLTMLVTARTCCHRLAARTGVRFFLVDLPAWSRKCLVCLAIMNERWNEDLLSKLDRQFELLADDTLEVISTQLTSPGASSRVGCRDQTPTTSSSSNQSLASAVPPSAGVAADPGGNVMIDHFGMDASTFHDADMGESWESFDFFREVLGNDSTQTFLDILGPETDYSVHGQRMLLA
ncbi:hypothetical protein ACCO45_001907 [Purpureocillium lilacinum]|uniref:Uncharacterized protein n=1 Tax=Purpureocillium lilacinum TaxID=33203 RepID=A0ACC4E994_PURLI